MGAENQSQVLCKNRMRSYLLSLLSGHRNHPFIAVPQSLLAPASNLVSDYTSSGHFMQMESHIVGLLCPAFSSFQVSFMVIMSQNFTCFHS